MTDTWREDIIPKFTRKSTENTAKISNYRQLAEIVLIKVSPDILVDEFLLLLRL